MSRKRQNTFSLQECLDKHHNNHQDLASVVGKYGYETVQHFFKAERVLSVNVPESMRQVYAQEICPPYLSILEDYKNCSDDILMKARHQRVSDLDAYILTPPLNKCMCGGKLVQHNPPTRVLVYTASTVLEKLKLCLRCSSCKTNFNYSHYGTQAHGFKFYDEPRDLIEATDQAFIDRQLHEYICAFGLHCWVSFEGFAESYSSVLSSKGIGCGLTRKIVSKAFFWGEVENEVRMMNMLSMPFQRSFEEYLPKIEEERVKVLYSHNTCSMDCQARGCGKLWVTDGLWKLAFPHCMMLVKNEVKGVPLVNYPEVCVEQLMPGKAFCKDHCNALSSLGVPTDLTGFLKHCGVQGDGFSNVTEAAESPVVHKYLTRLATRLPTSPKANALNSQSGQDFLVQQQGAIPKVLESCSSTTTTCNKNSGETSRMRRYTRGHMFVVRGGGHIDMWSPLYKSESLGQVFLLLLSWLYMVVQDSPIKDWSKMWLAYDNMCNLIKLRAAVNPLPLPAPYNNMFLQVNKIIDSLHLSNHKNEQCKTLLNPSKFDEAYPDLARTRNTQAAEQTFVWAGRFKKILCVMPKSHHLFYLHRMVRRRNNYTEKCYAKGKKPVLPSKK